MSTIHHSHKVDRALFNEAKALLSKKESRSLICIRLGIGHTTLQSISVAYNFDDYLARLKRRNETRKLNAALKEIEGRVDDEADEKASEASHILGKLLDHVDALAQVYAMRNRELKVWLLAVGASAAIVLATIFLFASGVF
jgi:hypothetical protein